MLSMLLFAAPPWVSPFARIVSAVVAALRSVRVSVNGVALAIACVSIVVGGWWVARSARLQERDRVAAITRDAEQKLRSDLQILIAARRGESAADARRIAGISQELRALIASIPAEIRRERETVFVPIATSPSVPPPPNAAARPVWPDYPDRIRDTLNKINIAPTREGK